MKQQTNFFKSVCHIAIPVALQSMLQSSFSIVDQIMIGQLGSTNIAGVGLAGKFSWIFSVIVAAIGTVAGIMIAQYIGQKNQQEIRRSFYINLALAVLFALSFTIVCICLPQTIMRLYTNDTTTLTASVEYLQTIAWTFLPLAGITLVSTLLRCLEKAQFPLYASIGAALLNTGLNYVFIFGKFGFPILGIKGAAIATVISQFGNLFALLIMLSKYRTILQKNDIAPSPSTFNRKEYLKILLPLLICEFMWSLGENVYAAIYAHIGTDSSAAMILINPIQGLLIGALSGLSQAAGIIVGKKLGSQDFDDAYASSKKLLVYGLISAILLSFMVISTRMYYVEIYQVQDTVKVLTAQILIAFAIIAPFKVLNMILGGGILRSGGKTKYSMCIDLIGTWLVGVPIGLICAFLLTLPVTCVYFFLSLEECVRFIISLIVFRQKKWMQSL